MNPRQKHHRDRAFTLTTGFSLLLLVFAVAFLLLSLFLLVPVASIDLSAPEFPFGALPLLVVLSLFSLFLLVPVAFIELRVPRIPFGALPTLP